MKRLLLIPLACSLLSLVTACAAESSATGETPEPAGEPEPAAETFTATNVGTNGLEGHTPRGFQGQGTGLFVGDNLNPNFPDGDGVQMFVSLDISDFPAGEVQSAVVSSTNASVAGDPFGGLGDLIAEEIRFEAFSSELFDASPIPDDDSCLFATANEGPFACDLTAALQRSLDDGYPYLQLRFRFDLAGDSDGTQDLLLFFLSDSNTNEPGIFDLTAEIIPDDA